MPLKLTESELQTEYDYIVVGSGAGGGPLASNLALAGHSVLVLEAGGDDQPTSYEVPAFHALSTEEDELRWSYYVKHYADPLRGKRDTKFVDRILDGERREGILYPRAGTLGGCTAHNALILIYPHNSDWDHIAETIGDPSWSANAMRTIFERMEDCHYKNQFVDRLTRGHHGFGGWLPTDVADAKLLLGDHVLKDVVLSALRDSAGGHNSSAAEAIDKVWNNLESVFDPNDWDRIRHGTEGITFTPLTILNGRRVGTRERLNDTRKKAPGKLTIRLHALVTKVVFDDTKRAVGVEFRDGAHLYRADPKVDRGPDQAPLRQVKAGKEVILCAGTFNTPQLLMLSGVGPAAALKSHGIDPVVDLPGVGRNLQDRYEIGVVYEVDSDLEILSNASFEVPAAGQPGDQAFEDWLKGQGVYTTNGAVIARIEKSSSAQPDPDLYLFGLAGLFKGYEPGYSKSILKDKKHFTWVALKAHTKNRAGTVQLTSSDPRDTPDINFHYFDEGSDQGGEDLAALVTAVQRIRHLTSTVQHLKEVLPGADCDKPEQIAQFVKDNAWGHHACGTCRIGPASDPMAVIDGDFRVHGTHGLRVVDASVFPRIPGFFIVSAVYMISEKASDVILTKSRSTAGD